jgi:hypothetical protein
LADDLHWDQTPPDYQRGFLAGNVVDYLQRAVNAGKTQEAQAFIDELNGMPWKVPGRYSINEKNEVEYHQTIELAPVQINASPQDSGSDD